MFGESVLTTLLLVIMGELMGTFAPTHGVFNEKKMHEAAAFPF